MIRFFDFLVTVFVPVPVFKNALKINIIYFG